MTSKIALLTCAQYIDLTQEDKLLVQELNNNSIFVDIIDWRNTKSDLSLYKMIVIRSVWDYHKYPDEFVQFLENNSKANFFNSIQTIKWNMNKNYLLEPRFSCYLNSSVKVFSKINDLISYVLKSKSKLVLKPIISAGARDTYLIEFQQINSIESQLAIILQKCPVMVCEYNSAIETEGELSLIFFDKVYSHCVRKIPKNGDFRVQEKFGGLVEIFEPSFEIIEKCREIINKVQENLLYARVDIIVTSQDVHLMELELFEPSLFMEYNLISLNSFTRAILSKI